MWGRFNRYPKKVEEAYKDKEKVMEALRKIKAKGLTQVQVAEYTQCPKSTVNNWLTKMAIPMEKKHRDLLMKLAEEL